MKSPAGTAMNRLLVVRCPDLLEEDENGAVLRSFASVIEATEVYCPWVTAVRIGVCSLPARGPARYFGGEEPLVRRITDAVAAVTPVEVGVADGLFASLLAARAGAIVAPGGTPAFLAPLPVTVLDRPELAELLDRLGIRTLGDFAALPERHVLGRFGADGVACHRVAAGTSGELEGLRHPGVVRHLETRRSAHHGETDPVGEPQFWGGVSDTDVRARRALATVQDLLGPEGVVIARLQGGRGPAQQVRFVTWNTGDPDPDPERGLSAPWPGRIPPPAPVIVHPAPLAAELVGDDGETVVVSGRGLLSGAPRRLSVEKGPWSEIAAWAGPWPSEERWWSRSARKTARLQAIVGGDAHLLLVERGHWWVEATYG
jgi:nucleotidyltransferase/DNA polymerase involved in DNA repair